VLCQRRSDEAPELAIPCPQLNWRVELWLWLMAMVLVGTGLPAPGAGVYSMVINPGEEAR
jgi:hypothetical protein